MAQTRLEIAKETAQARRALAHEQAMEIKQLKQTILELEGKAEEQRKRNEAIANAQLDYLEARYGKDSNLRPDILD